MTPIPTTLILGHLINGNRFLIILNSDPCYFFWITICWCEASQIKLNFYSIKILLPELQFVIFIYFCLRQGLSVLLSRLASNLLCRSVWLWTYRHLHASAFQVYYFKKKKTFHYFIYRYSLLCSSCFHCSWNNLGVSFGLIYTSYAYLLTSLDFVNHLLFIIRQFYTCRSYILITLILILSYLLSNPPHPISFPHTYL